MKRFVFAIAVFLPFVALAQQAQEATPCFQVEGTSDYYFGSIDQESTVEHVFIFKNTCKEVIEIEKAQASCGCTAAIVTEKTIQPGGEAKIDVKFTPPRGTRGKVTKTVSVYLKGKTEPHTVLRFSADVKTDLDIQPQYIQLLGAEVGTPISGKATIKNVTPDPIEITEIPFSATSYADTSAAGNFQTVAIPLNNGKVTPSSFTLKPGESKEVTVTLTPEYKGQINGSLRVKTKKNESYLQVFGIVRAKPVEGALKPAEGQQQTGTTDKRYEVKGQNAKPASGK